MILLRKTVVAWGLFDFANTFFAVAMLSFYFPLWVVTEHGAPELAFSLAIGGSMACVALLMPFLGALSDLTGQRMRFIRWTTYGCVAATALIGGTDHVGLALVLFALANLCYQLGTVCYDALLWTVAPAQRFGETSGLGAAFGYLGSMAGLLFLWPFVRMGGLQAAFVPSAIFFLGFALPSFFVIREPPPTTRLAWGQVIRAAVQRLAATLRSARALGGLWRYLWASFFALNAINTVLFFMAVYTRTVLAFSEPELIRFFVVSQAFAIAGSLAFGRLIPRWGAKRTLWWIWFGWMAALALLAGGAAGRWVWVIGPIIGLCLGATWATARVLVMELSPKDQLAEMFGLAGLFGRASAILGPMVWGLLVRDPVLYPHATVSLIVLLAIGLWLLRRV